MKNIVAFTKAKAKLLALLDRVSKGEEIMITRHNEMVAKLVPARRTSLEVIKQTISQFKALRKGVRISLDEMIVWKNEGRR